VVVQPCQYCLVQMLLVMVAGIGWSNVWRYSLVRWLVEYTTEDYLMVIDIDLADGSLHSLVRLSVI
jgi:hypothetical protein